MSFESKVSAPWSYKSHSLYKIWQKCWQKIWQNKPKNKDVNNSFCFHCHQCHIWNENEIVSNSTCRSMLVILLQNKRDQSIVGRNALSYLTYTPCLTWNTTSPETWSFWTYPLVAQTLSVYFKLGVWSKLLYLTLCNPVSTGLYGGVRFNVLVQTSCGLYRNEISLECSTVQTATTSALNFNKLTAEYTIHKVIRSTTIYAKKKGFSSLKYYMYRLQSPMSLVTPKYTATFY